MNPYRNTSPPPYSLPDLHDNSHNASLSATLSSPPVIQTGRSSVMVLSHNFPRYQVSQDHDGGQNLVSSPYSDSSASPLTVSDPGFIFRSRPQSMLVPASSPTPNPYPAPATPQSCQVSVIIPSPDQRPSPLASQCSEDSCPDLECAICFSQFNNVFRCPKMLQCRHTFCLECLARINVKSAEPNAIQCPLCRGLTPLPALGLPRLATNSDMLSYLPAAMQRVYSIRFLRNKGKLQVKRSTTSLRSVNRSLDVGLPSPPDGGRREADGVVGAVFRLTGRPACRAILMTSVVMMMILLTGIIIYLVTAQQ